MVWDELYFCLHIDVGLDLLFWTVAVVNVNCSCQMLYLYIRNYSLQFFVLTLRPL